MATPKETRKTNRRQVLLRAIAIAIAHHEDMLEGENGYAFKCFTTVTSYGIDYRKSMVRRELEEFKILAAASRELPK